ncbi:hydrolase 1, exosortase A system-associated, partial [Rubrivivax gelatinosus]
LADAGHPVLRFDVRGMGDSSGALRGFEQITPDIAAAVDVLAARAGVRRVVLWGLCDGASAALLYLAERRDPRIHGLCLLNPWVRSEAGQARTQVKHYYTRRLMQREFWLKIVTGRVAFGAIGELWQNLRKAQRRPDAATAGSGGPFQDRMAAGWKNFAGRTLLVLSGDDYTAKEFLELVAADARWAALMRSDRVTRHDLPEADHTFSTSATKRQLAAGTVAWMSTINAATTT